MPDITTETPDQLDAEVLRELDEAVEHLVTEDETPVDNLYSAKQQTLLKRALYASWMPPASADQPAGQKRLFLADVNIGLYHGLHRQPLVPDFLLSLDVQPHADWQQKKHRAYLVWEFGKVPEVVLEIVSNREGGELDHKLRAYAEMGARYYVVYDPHRRLSEEVLQVYELEALHYRRREDAALPEVGLRLSLWHGVFEDREDTWLRWCDAQGNLIPTGEERAAQAEDRALQAEDRAARLAAKLRELGIDPEQV